MIDEFDNTAKLKRAMPFELSTKLNILNNTLSDAPGSTDLLIQPV